MKLCDRLSKDYGVAMVGDADDSPQNFIDRLNRGDGVAVLAMAEGPLGVLRAMATRCGPVQPIGPFSLAMVKLIEGAMVMSWWQLVGKDGAA